MQPDDQGRERRKKEKNLAANEVLREIHNAVCTALKDFSRGGVFLYGPQQKCGQGGWGSWLWGLPCWANSANNSSLTSRLHSVPHSTAVKYVSWSTLSEPAFSANLRTMEQAHQLEGRCLYLIFKTSFKIVTNHAFVIETIYSHIPVWETVARVLVTFGSKPTVVVAPG